MTKGKWKAKSILLLGFLMTLCGCGGQGDAATAPGEKEEAPYHGSWAVPFEEAVAEKLDFGEDGCYIPVGGSKDISLSVPEDGTYELLLTYQAEQDIVLRSSLSAQVQGQSCTTQLFSVWRDVSRDYGTDRYGNEILPEQTTEAEPVDDYVTDMTGVSRRPFRYLLTQGEQTLTLTSHDVGLNVSCIRLIRADRTPDYQEYRSSLGEREAGADQIVIQGESYSVKSDSSIHAGASRNPSLEPFDYRYLLLSELDGSSFADVGQKVQYAFTVEHSGLYQLTFHYNQGEKEDIPVYRNIRLDGKTLFRELDSVAFAYTGQHYANLTVTVEGEPAEIWLEQGEHTLLLEADGTPLLEAVDRLGSLNGQLSAIGLNMKKLAGTRADANRTWDVESYLPGVLAQLEDSERELWEIYALLGTLQKEEPAAAMGIRQAVGNLSRILEEPDKIPGKLSLLSEGSGSATQLLSDQIDRLKGQALWVDCIYLQSTPVTKKANAGLFARIAAGAGRFLYSLTMQEETREEEVLQVWVNRPVEYVELIQALADTDFTPQTGIRVKLSTMSSEQRIVLSNATDMAPDVVMGLATNTPFDLGMRGAVADLSQFPGFAETMSEYNPQSLTPYTLGKQVFGATETQDFYVLMYRTDIAEALGIQPPRTWEDVKNLMPVLQRNSMNFYLQLSGYAGTKPLYSTAPFLMQAGGGIYGEGDATVTGVNSQASLNGFEVLTDLYRLYSVQPTVSSFYNSFRYGQIPMGICNFSDYILIRRAAPEIAGKWAIAPAPGMEDEQGVIHNGTTGASSACAILSGSDKQTEGWAFLQWWLSSRVQIRFGNTLQTTYGSSHAWNSANTVAFAQLNFPAADREVILTQWGSLQEINRHPALYAVERELSNAWQKVVDANVPVRVALDDAALNINREFKRKLAEFGCDEFTFVAAEEILEEAAHGEN